MTLININKILINATPEQVILQKCECCDKQKKFISIMHLRNQAILKIKQVKEACSCDKDELAKLTEQCLGLQSFFCITENDLK